MTLEYEPNIGTGTSPSTVPSTVPSMVPPAVGDMGRVYRNTVRDTWAWLWKDTTMRVLPFMAAAGVFAKVSGGGLEAVGLTRDRWLREVAAGVAVGVPLAGLAAVFRAWVAPTYRLPTPADQAVQTAFYFTLNAPAEELFWRGTVQRLVVRGLTALPFVRAPGLVGWAAVTAVFGAYHRLGNWSWRSIAGVTAAGALFGALYQWSRPKRSILAAAIAHGFATAGFLSWGDVYLHQRGRVRLRRQAAGVARALEQRPAQREEHLLAKQHAERQDGGQPQVERREVDAHQ